MVRSGPCSSASLCMHVQIFSIPFDVFGLLSLRCYPLLYFRGALALFLPCFAPPLSKSAFIRCAWDRGCGSSTPLLDKKHGSFITQRVRSVRSASMRSLHQPILFAFCLCAAFSTSLRVQVLSCSKLMSYNFSDGAMASTLFKPRCMAGASLPVRLLWCHSSIILNSLLSFLSSKPWPSFKRDFTDCRWMG